MEFLVELEINVPVGTPEAEVDDREKAEAVAAAKLVDDGHLVRLWSIPTIPRNAAPSPDRTAARPATPG